MKRSILKTVTIMLLITLCISFYAYAGFFDKEALTKLNINGIVLADILLLLIVVALLLVFILMMNTQRKIRREKMTDNETGAGNLIYFKHHFNHTITDTSRNQYYIAYLVLYNNYLRSYYDECSFEDVLKFAADTLSENINEGEFFARITESAFAIAYRSDSSDKVQERMNILTDRLNNFDEKSDYYSKRVFYSALYHLNKDDKDIEFLLFNLRKNCTNIIGSEKQIIVCDQSFMNAVEEEKQEKEDIIEGLELQEFKMYLQFIVDVKSGKIVSAEALSRWDSPKKGLVPPFKYIGKMETSGLISKHDFYMFKKACMQLEKWRNTEYEDIVISCNFTRITLSESNFITKLLTIADNYTFDRKKLAIEITEDSMEKNRETATANVMKCKELGFLIYLDDLGSGYTSLANLCDYPIDTVKIDRDILLKAENQKGKELFHGIIALAHNLSIMVISEGIETDEQLSFVKDSDCDFIQGWYYCKPVSPDEYESFIKSHNEKYGL